MDTDLTPAEIEAYARANANILPYMALEIRHSAFPAPVRLIDGNADRDLLLPPTAPLNGGETVTFQGVKLNVPQEVLDDEPDSQLQVQAGGLSGAVHEYLSVAAKSFEVAQVSQYRVSINVVTGVIQSVTPQAELEVRSYGLTLTNTTLSCGFTNTANRELQV